ncbi:hypothetical protein [Peribacillus sp. NPDC096540]|uniref:hypothetical protein n=1 Tax=Peribacillus sp. NPDC096540 TaxID=3390612 RepID=UPI003D077041
MLVSAVPIRFIVVADESRSLQVLGEFWLQAEVSPFAEREYKHVRMLLGFLSIVRMEF